MAVLGAATLFAAGCATFSDDGGFGLVEATVRERLGKDVTWVRDPAARESIHARVAQLLAQDTLSADDAVQIALLNNRGLQAAFAELGIAEADLVRAGRLPNPGFSYARLSDGHDVEIERGIHFNLAALLAMPLARRIEDRRFAQARIAAAVKVMELATDTRKTFYAAVAAAETAHYLEQVQQAAAAAAELAARMVRAGNWNRLNQAREQSFYADATAQLARARHAATVERERLVRSLGLWGTAAALRLPARLPDLPATVRELPDAERAAMAQRLDLQLARQDVEAVAQTLGLTRTTRFINVLEAGYLRTSETGAAPRSGYEIRFELPLFDFGGARVARAEAVYRQAVEQAAQRAVNARSEARTAYDGYRTAYDLARHYRDEVLPLHRRISEENLLRYNGMLIGVFELLADARSQAAGAVSYIEALRDFWLADADLLLALTGASPGDTATARATLAPAAGGSGAAH